MAVDSWNYHGTLQYVVDAEADLATVNNPKVGEVALALAEGSIWFHTGTAWQEIGGGSPAPADADYLVGTTNGSLSAEIVVGTSPGGELGGTWASPTVDTTHSGSAHADFIAKSVADAQGDLLLASAADTWARLPIGNNNEVLTSNGTTASWQVVGAASHPAYASHAKFGVD